MTRLVADALGIDERLVVPSSTGRIGVQLPRARVRRGVRRGDAALCGRTASTRRSRA